MPPASRRTTLCPTLTWGRKNVARFRQLFSVLVSWNVPEQPRTTGAPSGKLQRWGPQLNRPARAVPNLRNEDGRMLDGVGFHNKWRSLF
jgi:hypothetical protein